MHCWSFEWPYRGQTFPSINYANDESDRGAGDIVVQLARPLLKIMIN